MDQTSSMAYRCKRCGRPTSAARYVQRRASEAHWIDGPYCDGCADAVRGEDNHGTVQTQNHR